MIEVNGFQFASELKTDRKSGIRKWSRTANRQKCKITKSLVITIYEKTHLVNLSHLLF